MNNLYISVLMSGFMAMTAHGQEIKVRKVNGQKAVVQFSKEIVPQVDQVYSLSVDKSKKEAMVMPSETSDIPPLSIRADARSNFIKISNAMPFVLGIGGTFSVTTDFEYGWNNGYFEIAPSLGLDTKASFTFSLGLAADFNFVENVPTKVFVPAFTVKGAYKKGNSFGFGAGLAGKLYILGESQSAIRLALRFDGDKTHGVAALAKTLQILEIGIQTYF